jgi:carbon-monoxide dehydrogenase medium subunit
MGATVVLTDGRVSEARIAATGVGEVPVRIAAAEKVLAGASAADDGLLARVREAVMASIEPGSDTHVSADYRRHVAGALSRRVVSAAFARAKGQRP